ITARKQSEAALHEALERFETLAKATNDAVWDWDLLTDEVWWNEGFQTLFGHRPEETERTVATWVAFLHPEERDRVVGEIQTAIDRGDRTWTGEYRFRRKDGTYAHVLDRGYILHDEQGKSVRMIGAMQDITARKQSEIQLRESEERFRQLAENINEVFWISDPEKRQVFYVSPAYEKIWGRTCDSLYQDPRTWFESVHPEDRQRVLDAALNKQVTGEYDEVYRISRPDGSRRWIHDRAFPIRDADGHVHRIVGTAEDISARRQLEEQFRQAQKMEAIGQLAGGVAHDFNNILAAIMMQTDLSASEKDLAGEVPEGLREIRALAERAANLTRQLLLFSRKQVMHTRDLDLNEAVTGIFKMLQRIIGEHFSVQYDLHSASLIVRADPGMLDQVLLNLVVNARDAMPKGGPIIIKTSETQFSPEEAALIPDAAPGRYCCLCVQDSGCGIPPENLNRIFEPFFTTKGQGKGTGLGLATVFGIVKQHGGFVRVESQVGQGTTFQILLPAAIVAAAPPESKPGKATPRGGTETILLVEDEHSVRMVTRILLERAGYKVLEAVNGVQALQVWEQHHEPIHLLFTDIVMPGGMDGRELAASLEARNPRLKVILTSGYSAEMAGREIALKESQTFLQKPAASRLVLQTVRHALDH
ncbi:MAG: PAS domain-containing protein, partial [Verrucomicrobiota bacterium]